MMLAMKQRPLRRLCVLMLALVVAIAPTRVAARGVAPAAAPRALPAEVEASLAQFGVPREAMVAWVEEVGAIRARLVWPPTRRR